VEHGGFRFCVTDLEGHARGWVGDDQSFATVHVMIDRDRSVPLESTVIIGVACRTPRVERRPERVQFRLVCNLFAIASRTTPDVNAQRYA
jgi:hypothetical protein